MLCYSFTFKSCKSFYYRPLFKNHKTLISTTVSLYGSKYLKDLNDAQSEAVTRPLNNIIRVVAGPGAGKTRVLTSRIAYLLENDPTSRILAVTFTKKAAGEMQERLKILLEGENNDYEPTITNNNGIVVEAESNNIDSLNRVTLGTFHSVCSKILRWNGKNLSNLSSVQEAMMGSLNSTNLDGNFGIIDQADQLRIVRGFAKEAGIDLKKEKGVKPLSILNALGKIKAGKVKDEDIKKNQLLRIANMIYPYYRQHLFSTNALDFDDLIYMTRELLETNTALRDGLRKRWPHILVDEFQDTSQAQLDLVQMWSSNSLLVVGDADQSIYSWRGANIESMSDFESAFPNVKTVYLMENYRSTTSIVKAAQRIIGSSSSVTAADLRQDMKPMRSKGVLPRILACSNSKSEASFVVKEIKDMIKLGEVQSDKAVAILYRTNAQSRDLEEACVQNNLPYVVWGAMGTFYNRAEIKDCLCFLRWLNNGHDESAMMRSFKTPSRGIGSKALVEFQTYCHKVDEFYLEQKIGERLSPLDLLIAMTEQNIQLHPDAPKPEQTISTRAMNRFKEFSEQMNLIRKSAYKESVSDLINYIIEVLSLKDHFDSISKSSSEFEDRWNNVQELRKAAEKYTDGGIAMTPNTGDEGVEERPLLNFLDDVALVTQMSTDEESNNSSTKINLMTIHASKGMEFDVVYVVGNEDGTFPTARAIDEGEESTQLDEERRLCYVAMTRARNKLILTWRREVSSFEGDNFRKFECKRSRFLNILVSKKKEKCKDGLQEEEKIKASKQELKGAALKTKSAFVKEKVPKKHNQNILSSNLGVVKRNEMKDNKKRTTVSQGTQKTALGQILISHNEKQPTARKGLSSTNPGLERQRDIILKEKSKNSFEEKVKNSFEEMSLSHSWIYPVGSSVIHSRHGPGTVLPSPEPNKEGEILIRVKFEDGEEVDFPHTVNDLFPN